MRRVGRSPVPNVGRGNVPDWLVEEKQLSVGVIESEVEDEIRTWTEDYTKADCLISLISWLTKDPIVSIDVSVLEQAITKYTDGRKNYDKFKDILVWVKGNRIRGLEAQKLDSLEPRKE